MQQSVHWISICWNSNFCDIINMECFLIKDLDLVEECPFYTAFPGFRPMQQGIAGKKRLRLGQNMLVDHHQRR